MAKLSLCNVKLEALVEQVLLSLECHNSTLILLIGSLPKKHRLAYFVLMNSYPAPKARKQSNDLLFVLALFYKIANRHDWMMQYHAWPAVGHYFTYCQSHFLGVALRWAGIACSLVFIGASLGFFI